jgi:hypothetical protein
MFRAKGQTGNILMRNRAAVYVVAFAWALGTPIYAQWLKSLERLSQIRDQIIGVLQPN